MTPTGSPRSLRVMHRFSALLVAVLWSAAPVVAVVHASAETHRYCAEHGAVEESGERDGDVAASDSDSNAAVNGTEPGTSHEGCAFARYCRFGQVLGQFIVAATGEIEGIPIPTPLRREPAAPVAVLALAPKTSPPA